MAHKHFIIMLGLATLIHATIIGIYAMAPHQKVIQIPVRALNIKLGDDGGVVDTPAAAPPPPAAPKEAPAQEQPSSKPSSPVVINQPHTHSKYTSGVTDNSRRTRAESQPRNLAEEGSLTTPKKYVRENEYESGAGTGKHTGRSVAGTPEGDAIIQRYEQTISLWMAQHKTYPEMAKLQHIEGDAIVRIRISRNGQILESSIDHSSGNSIIDGAVLDMVRASNPGPAVPDDYPDGAQVEFLIPVSFRLQ